MDAQDTAISQMDTKNLMTILMDLKDSVKTLGDAKHTITHISKKHPLLRWIPRRVTTHSCQDLVTTQLAIKENVITPMVLVVSLAFI